jgi:photosystem II stability/assembly factor-like uncharacterized protein
MKVFGRGSPGLLIVLCWLILVAAGCGQRPAEILQPTLSPVSTLTSPPPAPTTAAPTTVISATPGLAASGLTPEVAFKMIDPQTGWGSSGERILRTTDGGQTWADVTPAGIPADGSAFPQLSGIDAQSAWVLLADPTDFKRGSLYRTSDGGQHWQMTTVPFGGGTIQHLNARMAWVLADRGVAAGSMAVDLFHTGDGGETWVMDYHIDPEKPGNDSLPFGGDKTGVVFRDALHGWVTGAIPMDGVSYFYATADGGKTWKQVQLVLPDALKNSQVLLDVPHFFDENNAVMPAHLYQNEPVTLFYISHDGGASWTATQPVKSGGLNSVSSLSDFFVWDGKVLFASQDAGQTWKEISPDINLDQKISGLQFISVQTGWALSRDEKTSQLYRTQDGGQTWQPLGKP